MYTVARSVTGRGDLPTTVATRVLLPLDFQYFVDFVRCQEAFLKRSRDSGYRVIRVDRVQLLSNLYARLFMV